jgi:hypothetical protein
MVHYSEPFGLKSLRFLLGGKQHPRLRKRAGQDGREENSGSAGRQEVASVPKGATAAFYRFLQSSLSSIPYSICSFK